MLLTGSLPLAYSGTFLVQFRYSSAPYGLVHATSISHGENAPTDIHMGQADDGNSPVDGPSSQVYHAFLTQLRHACLEIAHICHPALPLEESKKRGMIQQGGEKAP